MSRHGSCVAADRLTALALGSSGAENEQDRQLLAHVAACDVCAARLAALTAELDALRDAAWQEADAIFDDATLDAQRGRILARLAHLGQVARVLRFPARVREAAMPVSSISRRWISVAAAAGLIIGLIAGQTIHFVPWDISLHRRAAPSAPTVPPRASGPIIVQASSSVVLSTDDELLDEVDEAVQLPRAAALRALDEFTPRVGELIEIR